MEKMKNRLKVLMGMAITVLLLVGCSTSGQMQGTIPAIEKKISQARERGSYRCAPRELAMAEAHLEFMKYEMKAGDFVRARTHMNESSAAIDRALEITDPDKCVDKTVTIHRPQKLVVVADTDGDGILDDIDVCPDDAEDPDSFQDDDGCPDLDNDNDAILDEEDACPLEVGIPNKDPAKHGCPIRDSDGDGLLDDVDKCPDDPEDPDDFQDEDGCPDPDNDGDGVSDVNDKCPNEPEDKDGFSDEDGCPDPDNDGDGVLDVNDKCPNEAGPSSNLGCPITDKDNDGVPDAIDACPDVPGIPSPVASKNGCPRRILVIMTKDKIEIKQQIQFATGSAKIVGNISFEIIRQVNEVLKANPELKVVIEGHTDNRGNAEFNRKLSDQRAKAIMKKLIQDGVDPNRLSAIGYGKTKPIKSNNTAAGRAANRRVEFKIVDEDAPNAPAQDIPLQ